MNVNEVLHRVGLIEREIARNPPSASVDMTPTCKQLAELAAGRLPKTPELVDATERTLAALARLGLPAEAEFVEAVPQMTLDELDAVCTVMRDAIEEDGDTPIGVLARLEPYPQRGQQEPTQPDEGDE